jgi:hypothetical protein
MVWYGMVWYGMVWYGMVWYGMVWYGMVWYGMVWYGMVWYGTQYGSTEGHTQDQRRLTLLSLQLYSINDIRDGSGEGREGFVLPSDTLQNKSSTLIQCVIFGHMSDVLVDYLGQESGFRKVVRCAA